MEHYPGYYSPYFSWINQDDYTWITTGFTIYGGLIQRFPLSKCRALVPVHTPAVSPYRISLGINPVRNLNNYLFWLERYVRIMHKIMKDADNCSLHAVLYDVSEVITAYSNMIAWASR